ncbi:hypothetical protein NF27_HT00030 [Candidatus Jidaibacter acanthamoeba]|uniref:Uncharacterized protein n=1 Tax=Candidatus Jidaibacter acanthamoebae TaxID=86105 RepID=A0A0C1QJT1_9RICK|nr:hypothetical protein [Candidatus Jidaibacter acanthamoeba]KIE04413.1 hypothetical protein NF27_HT00030 [Candidatus Jidaibacter acanthamoeba]
MIDIKVSARFNFNYGMPIVTSKYSPLENNSITIDGGYEIYEGIINKRKQSLLLNEKIEFVTKLSDDERNNFVNQQVDVNVLPPVVIISSNRSGFIQKMLDQFRYWVTEIDDPVSPSPNLLIDSKPFRDKYPGLFYDPLRCGRNLIIVVHACEYKDYNNKLKEFLIQGGDQNNQQRIMLVGWMWQSYTKDILMAGFGASRVAAIKFLKGSNCPRAWLMDDNILHINQFPESLAIVEAQMDNNTSAIGFAGCTSVVPSAPGTIAAAGALDNPATTGILQQAVLWNISYMNEANQSTGINFSPYFIASNEDISFGEYLRMKGFAYKIYTNLTVIKLEAPLNQETLKNKGTIKLISNIKEILYELEKNYEITNLGMSTPKPLPIGSIIDNQSKQFTDNKNTVSCQIIEQILVAWIKSASGGNKGVQPAIDALFADSYKAGFKQIA